MQSYIKHKEYYDRKAKAAPLKENEYCFVLQPKADNQGSKIPFRDYRWVGPFLVQKVLPNHNYIVRRINTNKTQILHRIRLKKFVPNQPLEDNFREQRLQPDEEIFYTNDDDETEEQFCARKEAIRKNPATDEPTVTIQTLSTNLVKQHPDTQVRLRKTNHIIIEQSKDAVLQQLKAKLLHEEYSENLLHQDARYRHYANNLDRIVLKDEILTRQYFDETGNVK